MAGPSVEQLAQEYEPLGYKFLFVYTREAHPGEHLPPHTSFEQKMAHAQEFRERYGINRTILVDDLEGTAHHMYGLLPDMCYLVSKDRKRRPKGPSDRQNLIMFKADWTDADTLRMILEYQQRRIAMRQSNRKVGPNYCEFLGFRPRRWDEFRPLLEEECGPQAWADWLDAMEYWKENPPDHG